MDLWKIQLGKHYLDLGWYSVVTIPIVGGLNPFLTLDLVEQIRTLLSNSLIQMTIIMIIFVTLPLKTVVNQAKNEIIEAQ